MNISDPNIIAIYFHGSRAVGFASSTSDSDIAVVLYKRPTETGKIINLIEDQIDLPNPDIRLVDLDSSPVFLFSFVKSGKVLYEKNHEERIKFESMAMQKYYDTEHMRSIFRKYLYQAYAN